MEPEPFKFFLYWVFVLFAGIILGAIAGAKVGINELESAQLSYTECISLHAPREECLKKYLLPEKK